MADHFVIDGSNLATEGRTEPSLAQLHEAVDAFRGEHPGTTVTVVVDASFEHRIDPSERAAFSKAEIASEVVSPPAGAVGRGDGFLLQIANRTNATVVSNDSFQEFHAEYQWLFEPGRLIGGKPVPGVGWIFSLRRPVRGIVSRKTTQKAKKDSRDEDQVRDAIAEATADAMSSTTGRRRRRGGRGRTTESEPSSEPEAVNQPAPFLQFVIDHRLGTEVEGIVDAFSSHGAFVDVNGVRCYVPIAAMGEPRPLKARDVLTRGETRTFVIQAVDAPRRGIELALPGFAKVAGTPSDETVEVDVMTSRPKRPPTKAPARRPAKSTGRSAAPAKSTAKSASKSTSKSTVAKSGSTRPTTARGVAKAVAATPAKRVAKATAAPTTTTTGVRGTAAKTAAARTAAKAATAKKVATTTKRSAPAKKAGAIKKAAPTARTAGKPVAKKSAAAKKVAATARPVVKPAVKKAVTKTPAKATAKAAKKSLTKPAPTSKQRAAPAAKRSATAKTPAAKKRVQR